MEADGPPDGLPPLAEEEAVDAAEIAVPPRPRLLPKPALGREAAVRGTKRPLEAVAGDGPDKDSSTIFRVLPLKMRGSGCNSNLPASYTRVSKGTEPSIERTNVLPDSPVLQWLRLWQRIPPHASTTLSSPELAVVTLLGFLVGDS